MKHLQLIVAICLSLGTISSPAHAWSGFSSAPPSRFPECPNGHSPDGTVPGNADAVEACWILSSNWQPIPECARPFNGTAVYTYFLLCHRGGCVPTFHTNSVSDEDVPKVIAACLAR